MSRGSTVIGPRHYAAALETEQLDDTGDPPFRHGVATPSSGRAIAEINDPVEEQFDRIRYPATLFLS
jgi:hypothetical protein